jgi:transcriptional regulator with XRE-family HTH domain
MTGMSAPHSSDPPPEGLLLEQARERMDISQNEAGRRAEISGTRWRQIVNEKASEMTSSRGVKTLARMATVVDVTAEQFAEVGREDVAEVLRERKGEPSLAELAERLEQQEQTTARLAEQNEDLRRMLHEITGKDPQSAGNAGGEEPESDKPRQAM